jgi:hypothetical protein
VSGFGQASERKKGETQINKWADLGQVRAPQLRQWRKALRPSALISSQMWNSTALEDYLEVFAHPIQIIGSTETFVQHATAIFTKR